MLWIAVVRNDPFFWDTVQLGSKHAHFFYAQELRWEVLPNEIDSGHPPLFGYYLAFCWTLFGKSLAVSHWAMLPFLYGVFHLAWRIGQRWSSPRVAPLFLLLVLADPVIATQSALVSPDLVLLFFFMLSLEAIWSRRQVLLAVAVLGLCLISMRGMMVAAAVGLWALLRQWPAFRQAPAELLKISLPFLPGFMAALLYLVWHFQQTGWIGYHNDSPWSAGFERSSGLGLMRNLAILAWRWLDLGRLAEWGLLIYLLLQFRRKFTEGPPRDLLLLFISCVLLLSPSALLYQNLSAHRYFIPAFFAFHLLLFSWAGVAWQSRKSVFLVAACSIMMMTGHAWLYPRGISMDWDCTLAHRSYHPLREEMLRHLKTRGLNLSEVGSAFPNLNTGEDLMLNGDPQAFAAIDLERQQYVLCSNIFNDIDLAEYRRLSSDWFLEKRIERSGIWMELYQKKAPDLVK